MPDEYLSFEDVLRELQMQEAELRAMVAQGKLRAFRDENTLKFRRSDVEDLRSERETEATTILSPEVTPPPPVASQPVSEDPIDLLADDILDYDDTAETIIGGDLDTSEADLGLGELEPEPAGESSSRIPTIELTPSESSTEETAVPTLEISEEITEELGEAGTDSETEVPTMVLGLDEYDDTQVATEEVATEEVFIDESELEESATAEVEAEEPYLAPEAAGPGEEAEEAVGRITSSSSVAARLREEPSALYTAMSAIAAVVLLIPGSVFFYCMISKQVPNWPVLQSIMAFFLEQFFGITPPPSMSG